MKFTRLLRKLPIDFAQGEMREKTKGKLIAFSYVPKAKKGQKALDVGCREQYWTKKMKAKGYTVESIDLFPVVPNTKKVDVEKKLPYKNNSFDLVWCSEVIEHLKTPKFAINEMTRVCKPGGRVLITTPNSYFFYYRILNIFGIRQREVQNPDHKQFFRLSGIKKIVPKGTKIFGFFPHIIIKFKIGKGVSLLSPTFVIIIHKKK